MATEVLSLSEILQSQANKYITHNTALREIEAKTVRALSRTNSGPPGSPAEGDVYIIDTATGAWATGSVNDIAHYYNSSWHFYTPGTGWRLWLVDEYAQVTWDATSWTTEIRKAEFRDYREVVKTIASAPAICSVSFASANVFDITMKADTTFAFSDAPASGLAGTFTIILRQDGTGGWDPTWPTTVDFASGVTPAAASTASAYSYWSFMTINAGASYGGFLGGQNMS
jgi:hypothetical protein